MSKFSRAGVPGKITAQSTLALVYKGVVTCMYGKHVEASYTEKLIEGIRTDSVSFGRNVSAGASFGGFIKPYCSG